jgi:hypothetical protein
MGLDVRHNMLNKFLSPQDMSFRTVAFHLKELTQELQAGKGLALVPHRRAHNLNKPD